MFLSLLTSRSVCVGEARVWRRHPDALGHGSQLIAVRAWPPIPPLVLLYFISRSSLLLVCTVCHASRSCYLVAQAANVTTCSSILTASYKTALFFDFLNPNLFPQNLQVV